MTNAELIQAIIIIAPSVLFAVFFPDASTVVINLSIYGLIAFVLGSLLFFHRR